VVLPAAEHPRTDTSQEPRTTARDVTAAALLLRAKQAAVMLGVSTATWYRLVSAGRTPQAVRLSQGLVRWRRSDLLLWIDMGCPGRAEFEARRAAE
jgi:predicted DNA-binding transcriptional regulator AlpA